MSDDSIQRRQRSDVSSSASHDDSDVKRAPGVGFESRQCAGPLKQVVSAQRDDSAAGRFFEIATRCQDGDVMAFLHELIDLGDDEVPSRVSFPTGPGGRDHEGMTTKGFGHSLAEAGEDVASPYRALTLRFDEIAEPAKINERVDAGAVTVSPGQTQGVVSHTPYVTELQVVIGLKTQLPGVPLATRAGTIAAQQLMGDLRLVAVGPSDDESPSPKRSLDTNGAKLRIGSHGDEKGGGTNPP